jgi:RNA polymerase-associated protein RTF1
MGDEDDRARLAGMTELEREEILADRRDRRAQTADRKRIIAMAREKKEREAGGKKKFRPADAEAAVGRKSKRVAGEEAARGTTSKSKALAEIARKKERRQAEEDSDEDDSDEYGSDDDLEDEDLDGILPQREKRKPASRGRGGRDDDSDVSDDDDEDGGGDAVPASEAQIRKIFLKRSTLEKWIAEPYFAQLAPGCMVRIGIGLDKKSGEPRYRLAEITQVAEGTHGNYPLAEYELYGKPGVKTPFHLVLKFGKHERAFKANEVSNQDPTAKEFAEWTAQMRVDEQRPLRVRDTDAALENIRAAENYRYTSEDVQAMLKKRQEKKGGLTHNLANQKEVLRRLVERAKAEGDEDAARDLSSQLDEVVKRLTKKLDKGGTQAIMANINKRNNAINDANLSRTAAEAIARAKSGKPDESANDPFSRRPTRMATYYTINGEKEREKTKEGEEKTKGTSDTSGPAEVGNATKRENAGRAGETASRSFAEQASAREARFVGAHKKVSLAKVDPSLAAAPDPAANAGIHPGLVPVLRRGLLGLGRGLLEDVRPVRPKGKTLTLEEYKVRQGVE